MAAVVVLDGGGAVHDPAQLVFGTLEDFGAGAVCVEDDGVGLIVLAGKGDAGEDSAESFRIAADVPGAALVVIDLEIVHEDKVDGAFALGNLSVHNVHGGIDSAQHGADTLSAFHLYVGETQIAVVSVFKVYVIAALNAVLVPGVAGMCLIDGLADVYLAGIHIGGRAVTLIGRLSSLYRQSCHGGVLDRGRACFRSGRLLGLLAASGKAE